MIFPVLFLITGLALLIAVPTHLPLSLILIFLVMFATSGGVYIWKRFSLSQRQVVVHRIKAGLIAGFLATAAYDLSRFLLINVFPLHVRPFEAIPLFGQLLVGDQVSHSIHYFVGGIYHLSNGVGFAIAYSIWFATRGWWCGIMWALVLEAAMLAIYPGWLDIKMMDEFVSVSVIGHLIYGATLGSVCKWRVLRKS